MPSIPIAHVSESVKIIARAGGQERDVAIAVGLWTGAVFTKYAAVISRSSGSRSTSGGEAKH